ncbi:MAG: GIY-YIG nuclease family protein [Hyphomicrobium sp.]|jgi:putative endonuclease
MTEHNISSSSRGRPCRPWRSSALLDCFVAETLRNDGFVRGDYYVYIVTNRRNGTLYTGVTNDLKRRVWQHKYKTHPGFTAQYNLGRLVYFETYQAIIDAIDREKQIKAGSRAKKIALIEKENPSWSDLSTDWFG